MVSLKTNTGICKTRPRKLLLSYLQHTIIYSGKNGVCILPGYVPATELKPKQNNLKLTDEHPQIIEHYVEKHPTCTVKDTTDELCKAFESLKIYQFTVYRHITDKLSFTTLTRTQLKNMVRPVAWSKKGQSADVEVPTQQGTNLSVLGCMSCYGLISLSQQVPRMTGFKRCKIVSKNLVFSKVHLNG
ncbi:hypothetical protein BDB00DRAFT_899986 [Zychaea mexicana]|uniref:uncharacterized protein n=1 Tax=Zychaea mexicana TaxID=64656 RepID=UPI0022FE2BD5|nr:uncharacterized protein BDB00DRAFT_899986 [Zychaea mexicana]KAI9470433.1 hypothetical protein BDB00DRAFT_899986 [Zychaea mexicana]